MMLRKTNSRCFAFFFAVLIITLSHFSSLPEHGSTDVYDSAANRNYLIDESTQSSFGPAHTSQGGSGDENNTLADKIAPVRWNKSLESGMISTAPIASLQGVVVAKVGGEPMLGISAGLRAFYASNGTPLWQYDHSASTSGFEIAPLIDTWGFSSNDCASPAPLAITGWTDGNITAHYLVTGELAWSISTEKHEWGITSSGFLDSELWMLSEGEMLHICEANGTVLDRIPLLHDGVQQTVYRAGIGTTYSRRHAAVATENATLHIIDRNSATTFATANLAELANLSGEWKVRSRPMLWDYRGNVQWNETVLLQLKVQITNQTEGRMLLLNVSTDGEISIWDMKESSSSSVLTIGNLPIGYSMTVESGVVYGWGSNESGLTRQWIVDLGGPVTGEIGYIGENIFCFPVNRADGRWVLWEMVSNQSTHLDPEANQTDWLTAGCGGFGLGGISNGLLAFGNDGSWLEVRYSYDISTLFETEFNDSLQGPTTSVKPVTLSPGESEENSAAMVAAANRAERDSLLFGIIVTTLAATALFWRMLGPRRLQVLSVIWLVALLASLPALDATVNELATELVQNEGDPHDGLPAVWHDSQVVCFYYVEETAPSAYSDGVHHIAATGSAVHFDALPEDNSSNPSNRVNQPNQDDQRGVCVGGIRATETVEEATEKAAGVAGLELELELYSFGNLLTRIGDVDAGDDQRHWLFWTDGAYGTRAIDQTEIASDAVISWRFMTESEALSYSFSSS
jgi:hypothetical protein